MDGELLPARLTNALEGHPESDAYNRVIAAACAYIHGSSDERQKNYTAWRNAYRDTFAEWPASLHVVQPEVSDG